MSKPTNSKAIVTLAIGSAFAKRWHSICEPHWRRYCQRHGYDLICFEEPLDTSGRARRRSPAWQKCLILGQPLVQQYEQVVWLDSDILPNPEAPSVADFVPVERVGAVDEYSMPTREIHSRVLAKLYRRWDADGIDYVHNLTAAGVLPPVRPGLRRSTRSCRPACWCSHRRTTASSSRTCTRGTKTEAPDSTTRCARSRTN